MRTQKKKTKEPKVSSRWVTTDDEEHALRRERAQEETMRIRPQTPRYPNVDNHD
jgi:hypothetical protein